MVEIAYKRIEKQQDIRDWTDETNKTWKEKVK